VKERVTISKMSQTKIALKQIASSEEYKALAEAIGKKDFATISHCYSSIGELLGKAKEEIREKIQNLPRKNKEEEYQKFAASFDIRARGNLPLWFQIDSELKNRGVTEGRVIGTGSKGDPVVRTESGRLFVLNEAKVAEGERVRFRVTGESEKVDFGRVFELTAESFYAILTEDTREKIRTSFKSLRERTDISPNNPDISELDGVLKELENVRELAEKLQPEERDNAFARVKMQRKRLLGQVCLKMMFDIIAAEEEEEVREMYAGDEKKIADALAAPGLFRKQSHEKSKEEMFSGEEIRGYAEVLSRKEQQVENMQVAMEVLQYKSTIEEAIPKAKDYLSRMDRLYDGLTKRLNRLVPEMVEADISEARQIYVAIKDAFESAALLAELRRVFHGTEDFSSLRTAFMELRSRFCDPNSAVEEAAFRPYIRQKTGQAFSRGRETAQSFFKR
jgi:hypothetical protein